MEVVGVLFFFGKMMPRNKVAVAMIRKRLVFEEIVCGHFDNIEDLLIEI